MKEKILNLKGGEFKEWYNSLSPSAKGIYKRTIEEIKEEYYKDGKGKRYLGHNNPKKNR